MNMQLDNKDIVIKLEDSRRLTGKNLLSNHPGAIIDALVDGIDKSLVVEHWTNNIQFILNQIGWQKSGIFHRIYENGVSLAICAPMDALYAATEINEFAWNTTVDEITNKIDNDDIKKQILAKGAEQLAIAIQKEVNPKLMALLNFAKDNQIPYLVDDDFLSFGYGKSAQTWQVNELPNIEDISVDQYTRLPIALITGTNGKSTSVRILSQIFKEWGKTCGVTSTDFIRIGENILDKGDYSGPGGARMLLRHKDTEVAVLEVARGGILRRGLPVEQVDAALITNIADDHLGQYGINTVEDLAKAKAVVAKAVNKENANHGTLVLNADDELLVNLADKLNSKVCWFSLDENNSAIQDSISKGLEVCFLKEDDIYYIDNTGKKENMVNVKDLPMTLGGAARHNIQNAMGAIAMAKAMKVDDISIKKALLKFTSDSVDNPGRGNQFLINGAKVILDFAHNMHGMQAMAETTRNIKANKKYLMLSHAGDRSNEDIIKMTKAAMTMKPDIVFAVELKDYLRGRQEGDIPSLISKTVIEMGLDESQVRFAKSPLSAVTEILDLISEDDLALLMVLSEREQVMQLLHSKNTSS